MIFFMKLCTKGLFTVKKNRLIQLNKTMAINLVIMSQIVCT